MINFEQYLFQDHITYSPSKRQKTEHDAVTNTDTDTDAVCLDESEIENIKEEKICENKNESEKVVNDRDVADTESNHESETSDSSTSTIELSEGNLISLLLGSFNAKTPRELLGHMIPSYVNIPDNFNDMDICRLIFQMMANEDNLTRRTKLVNVNTINDCIDLIRKSNKIIVLTGAGCSVSCGIPDFRSRDGIYARLHKDFPDLPDPQSMFDICYFQHNPKPFFKFAKEIYPGQFKPSLSHLFIKKIEDNRKLLRNYTQNIDTLELTAGINNVIQCHGECVCVHF